MSSPAVCLAIFVAGLMVGCQAKPSDIFARVASSYPGGSKWVLFRGDGAPVQPPSVVQTGNGAQVSPANRHQSHHQTHGSTRIAANSEGFVKVNPVEVPAAAPYHEGVAGLVPDRVLVAPVPLDVSSDRVDATPATFQQPPKPIDVGTPQASQIKPRPIGDYAPDPEMGDADTVVVDSKPVQNNDWYTDEYVPEQYPGADYYPQYENDYEETKEKSTTFGATAGASVPYLDRPGPACTGNLRWHKHA